MCRTKRKQRATPRIIHNCPTSCTAALSMAADLQTSSSYSSASVLFFSLPPRRFRFGKLVIYSSYGAAQLQLGRNRRLLRNP
mmetsp:Transcript_9758/g.21898  ORF Transcript_9758/g.21898 Transcript_9758/m.21898 type:complete len:82 (+) Transcript_9758:560-805(+)